MKKIRAKFADLPIARKLILAFLGTMATLLAVNLLMFGQINRMLSRVDQVFISNVSLGELSDCLGRIQSNMYDYLSTKSSTSLEEYYRQQQDYLNRIEQLNTRNLDNEILLLEKNIYHMSGTYLDKTQETVQAKRGRNVELYKDAYAQSTQLYEDIISYIEKLNNLQFKSNGENYRQLLSSMRYLEASAVILLILILLLNLLAISAVTGSIVSPLSQLAKRANQVAQGDLDVPLVRVEARDEVGVVTEAFNTMVDSIRRYIRQTTENMEKEQRMREREYQMENHLKDAQLKYLQAQVNPHFLYNSLNAGAQLAQMEDAEKTCLFIERMADFFRYNVRRMSEDSTLGEELEAVDNYIYILNVRFAGDIHFEKEVPADVRAIRVPSMILQPLVENAVNYGIRNIEWEGWIHLSVERSSDTLQILVRDNGLGMTAEQIAQVLRRPPAETTGDVRSPITAAEATEDVRTHIAAAEAAGDVRSPIAAAEASEDVRSPIAAAEASEDVRSPIDTEEGEPKKKSTGTGIRNVSSRLELYYNKKDLLEIESDGPGKGTVVRIRIPLSDAERAAAPTAEQTYHDFR